MYDASGAKLRKIANNNGTVTTYDYVNGVEYTNNTLERIPHTEGEIVKDGSGNYVYEYTLKDHLGNTRVTFGDADNNGLIVNSDIKQLNSYYPFGLNMEGPGFGAQGANKYQFGDKELNTDFGLNWSDFGARWYQSDVPRFLSIDPMAEMYGNMSPYHYGMNSPIVYADPTGMMSEAYSFGMSGSSGSAHDMYQRDAAISESATGKARDVNEDDIKETHTPNWEATRVEDSEGNVLIDNCDCGCPTKPPCKGVTYHYKRKTNNLDPSSLYKNLLGTSYPGPFNPYRYNGLPDYSYSPGYMKFSEYPAIGHDRAYDLLQVKGGGGLFLETNAISADWRFVKQEFSYGLRLWSSPYGSKVDQTKALTFGTLLGLAALPKTIYSFSNPILTSEVFMWNSIFKAKVNNIPSK